MLTDATIQCRLGENLKGVRLNYFVINTKVIIMKNFSLKIACVFIILMYCLAPLSAFDLNQDDNNKYIEHDTGDSSIDTKDVDVADEQNDGEDVVW